MNLVFVRVSARFLLSLLMAHGERLFAPTLKRCVFGDVYRSLETINWRQIPFSPSGEDL